PPREHGQLEQIVEVAQGRVQREEGVHLHVVELHVRADGGDHPPVERKQGSHYHDRQRDLEREGALEPAPVLDRHQSLRRMYQSWNTITMSRNGNRVSEIEAPWPSFAARMAIS